MRARTLLFALSTVLACSASTAPLVTPGGTLDMGRLEFTGTALARSAFAEQVTVYSQSRVNGLFSSSGASTGKIQKFQLREKARSAAAIDGASP